MIISTLRPAYADDNKGVFPMYGRRVPTLSAHSRNAADDAVRRRASFSTHRVSNGRHPSRLTDSLQRRRSRRRRARGTVVHPTRHTIKTWRVYGRRSSARTARRAAAAAAAVAVSPTVVDPVDGAGRRRHPPTCRDVAASSTRQSRRNGFAVRMVRGRFCFRLRRRRGAYAILCTVYGRTPPAVVATRSLYLLYGY